MTELKQMTVTELKQYLSDGRGDDDRFSEALRELLSRDRNPVIYPADMPLEEIDRVMRAKIEQERPRTGKRASRLLRTGRCQ